MSSQIMQSTLKETAVVQGHTVFKKCFLSEAQ